MAVSKSTLHDKDREENRNSLQLRFTKASITHNTVAETIRVYMDPLYCLFLIPFVRVYVCSKFGVCKWYVSAGSIGALHLFCVGQT